MTELDTDTGAAATGTPNADGSAAADPNAEADSQTAGDGSDALLRSRYAGQTAKVNQLTEAQKALEAERDALKKQLEDAQKGVIDKDQALKDQLAAKEAEAEAARRETRIARLEAKYPETFSVLGESAADLDETKLSEAEARFAGTDAEAPTPRSASAPRPGIGAPKEQTKDDIIAEMRKYPIFD